VTRIRARCPGCGDVEFGIESIVVLGSAGAAASYRFDCPGCADSVERSAVPEVLELLMSAGVRCAGGRDTRDSRDSRDTRPPLTERDLEQFETLLSKPDWFRTLELSLRNDNF